MYIQKIPPVIVARQRTYHQHTTSSLAHRYRPDRLTETRTITGYTRARKIPSVCSSGAQSFSVFPRQAAATVRDADARRAKRRRESLSREIRLVASYFLGGSHRSTPPPPGGMYGGRGRHAPPLPSRHVRRRNAAAAAAARPARNRGENQQKPRTPRAENQAVAAHLRDLPGAWHWRRSSVSFRRRSRSDGSHLLCSGTYGGTRWSTISSSSSRVSLNGHGNLSLSPSPPDAMPRRNVAPTSSTTTVNVYSKQSYSYPEKQTNQSRKRTGYTVAKPGTKITEV